MTLIGIGVASGRCCARPHLLSTDVAAAVAAVGGDGGEPGLRALDAALEASHSELISIEEDAVARVGGSHAEIFASHRMILEDVEWVEPIRARVAAGEAPARAVWAVTEALAEEMRALPDDYLRERATDVLDVGKRVLRHLGCRVGADLPADPDQQVVLVAHDLTPSDTIGLDPAIVRGIVTEGGARTSHAAILARQLGIPAVVGVAGLLEAVQRSALVALDGDSGECDLDPAEEKAEAYRAKQAAPSVIFESVETLDGAQVTVLANASDAADVARAIALGADGIGLYRTEFLFLRHEGVPDEAAQVEAYSAAAAAADGRPIVFRTLDVGADKAVPGIELASEDNPFLGVRGVRLLLRRRELLDDQLRALARTAEQYPNVRVMVPMICDVAEMRRVQAVADELGLGGLRLGTMIEVPSAALLVRELAAHVDFVSVGTNDLTGYVLAVDRTNVDVQELYDELHPGVLRLLDLICTGGRETQTPVSVCGEVAGDPAALPVLVGLGVSTLSVAAPLVPRTKAAIQTLSMVRAQKVARRVLACGDASEARAVLSRSSAADA